MELTIIVTYICVIITQLKAMKIKYTCQNILSSGKFIKYLFFWGHQPSKNKQITKSCFSQWWVCNFSIDSIEYTSTEHFMMAEKAKLFKDLEIWQKIIDCSSPAAAKNLGRQVKGFDQEIWEAYRFEIVKKGNFHKFSQNQDLANFLIQTNKRILVEASPVDAIWGIGLAEDHHDANNPKKWRGLNLLGFVLMEVRDELIKK